MQINKLQNDFQNFLMTNDESITDEIISTEKASAKLRLDVYQNAYYIRLIEILAINYPVLKKILTEEKFSKVMTDYINAYPSTHFSIRIFGRNLSKFLRTYTHVESYLADLADFEWNLSDVLEAKDAPTLTIEEMSAIAPDQWAMLGFSLHPSVVLLPLHYDAPELWKTLRTDDADVEKIKQTPVDRTDQSCYWMIWRCNYEAYFAPLNAEQLHMIQAIQAGKAFGEICEELCEYLDEEEVIQFAAGNLRSWVGDGVLCEIPSPCKGEG